jgi:hypothetical protein
MLTIRVRYLAGRLDSPAPSGWVDPNGHGAVVALYPVNGREPDQSPGEQRRRNGIRALFHVNGDVVLAVVEQWPPVSNRGAAPGITIVLRDRTVVLTNESADSYWLSPPIIELWEGGAPWVVVVEPDDGSLELGPGDELELVIGDRSDTVRAGARLWPDAIIDGSEEPWFNWLEVEANQ